MREFETSIFRRICDWSRDLNEFAVHDDHLKHPFLDLTQVSFWSGEGAENEFKVLWEYLKYRFFDFIQVAFCACQEAENDFKVPFDHQKIALSPSNKLHFGLVKTQNMRSKCYSTT